jgi:hypothetical protein
VTRNGCDCQSVPSTLGRTSLRRTFRPVLTGSYLRSSQCQGPGFIAAQPRNGATGCSGLESSRHFQSQAADQRRPNPLRTLVGIRRVRSKARFPSWLTSSPCANFAASLPP